MYRPIHVLAWRRGLEGFVKVVDAFSRRDERVVYVCGHAGLI